MVEKKRPSKFRLVDDDLASKESRVFHNRNWRETWNLWCGRRSKRFSFEPDLFPLLRDKYLNDQIQLNSQLTLEPPALFPLT